MAKLATLEEQHLERQPPTVVIQATTWWETVLAHVKLQECGRAQHLPAFQTGEEEYGVVEEFSICDVTLVFFLYKGFCSNLRSTHNTFRK